MRRRAVIGAVGSLGAALCLVAATGARAEPGRFTLTRTLPDGRTEVRSVTLEELKALMRPPATAPSTLPPTAAAPSPDAASTVVFALPPPIPDAVAPTPAPARSATPSAAAILAARRAPGLAAKPLPLSGGWTVAERPVDDEASDDAAAPALASGRPTRRKAKGAAPLGVRKGESFGDQGRFYLYAGVKNRGVGLNLTDQNGEAAGGWEADGVSYDRGGFAGQRSAGLGWRQGDLSTSLGWVHAKTNVLMMHGAPAEKDDRVALTFSWRPHAR